MSWLRRKAHRGIHKVKVPLCQGCPSAMESFDLPAGHLTETGPLCFPQMLVVDETLPRFERLLLCHDLECREPETSLPRTRNYRKNPPQPAATKLL